MAQKAKAVDVLREMKRGPYLTSREPGLSAQCGKNLHCHCFKLNCICWCHMGGMK
jgi:hypothetical protein